ncbi:predicted protein [Naegleria gruberi]|uniref:Predicted protein n=1 Tax=Naegleria gruberi TaxID=5762 RepID=D2W1L9_NAEGR|nr:uncharacterized protein NAEGRDRAFT_75268 [Naegleria gruberi]EFC37068.1 predicted protein [Naegleria gruberi]|eukprot:XP_002669812.1 predicted protein [Naegleria gruberi strain NEG-M]
MIKTLICVLLLLFITSSAVISAAPKPSFSIGRILDNIPFYMPASTTQDSEGNLFIADTGYNVIRKIDTNNVATIFAGIQSMQGAYSGDGGPPTGIKMFSPYYMAFASNGDLYWTESNNCIIRKYSKVDGIVTTIAGIALQCADGGDGGLASVATLRNPTGLTFTANGDLLVATSLSIRKIDVNGIITTLTYPNPPNECDYSGDGGLASNARVCGPQALLYHAPTGDIYWAEYGTNRIRKITSSTNIISTVAGTVIYLGYSGDNGPANQAQLSGPYGMVIDKAGNLYFTEVWGMRIRFVSAQSGNISTIAGNGQNGFSGDGGDPLNAALGYVSGISQLNDGSLIFTSQNSVVRKLGPSCSNGMVYNKNNGGCECPTGYKFTPDQSACEVVCAWPNGVVNGPTPIVSSNLLANGIELSVKFARTDATSYAHVMKIGSFNFNAASCVLSGSEIALTLTNSSSCTDSYTTGLISFDSLIANPSVSQIQLTSNVAVTDYRALMYFAVNVTLEQGIPENRIVHIPLNVDYQIIVQPTINGTLQATMSLSDTNGQSQTKFTTNDKVNVNILSGTSLGSNKLSISDAFFCCFKQFTASISYNPSQGQFGCSKYDSATMEVWSTLIANSAASGNLQTVLNPSSGNTASFSFQLLSSIFPAKESPYSTSCFIQSNVGISPSVRSVSVISSVNPTEVDSMLVVNIPQGTKVVSKASSVIYSTFLIALLFVIMFSL